MGGGGDAGDAGAAASQKPRASTAGALGAFIGLGSVEDAQQKVNTLEFTIDADTKEITDEPWEIIFKLGVLKYKEQEYRRELENSGEETSFGGGKDVPEVRKLREAQKALESTRYTHIHEELERIPGIIGNLLMDARHSQLKRIVDEYNYPLELVFIHYETHAVRCWDIMCTLINQKDDPLYWNVIKLILMRAPSVVGLRLLEGNVHDTRSPVNIINYDPEELDGVTEFIVQGSRSPIAACLLCANLYKEKAEVHLATADEYEAIAEKYTELSLGLLDQMESDHGAALLLEAPSEGRYPYSGPSALQIAVDTENYLFLANSRIVRVVSTMWWHPEYLHPDNCRFASHSEDISRLLLSPTDFYRSPIGKFSTQGIGFFAYIFVFSWVTLQRPCIYDVFVPVEYIFWFMNLGFVLHEVLELVEHGPSAYAADSQNKQDGIITVLFVVLAFLRLTATNHDPAECATTADQLRPVIYTTSWSVTIIMMWVRVSFLFVMDDQLGPLFRMLSKMAVDIRDFMCLMALFFLGFMLAFYYFVGDYIEQFSKLSTASLWMFQISMGAVEWDMFDATEDGVEILPESTRNMAMGLLFVYVIIAVIIMLNLLIAMMAKTFMQVQEVSKLEFTAGRATKILELYKNDCTMPAPFNVFVYLIYAPKAAPDLLQSLFSKAQALFVEEEDHEWICGFCHEVQKESQADQVLMEYLAKLKKKDLISTEDMTDVIASKVTICRKCNRVMKEIPVSIQTMEVISIYVYFVIVWPFLFMLLGLVPWTIVCIGYLLPGEQESHTVEAGEVDNETLPMMQKDLTEDKQEGVTVKVARDMVDAADETTRDRVRRVFEDMSDIQESDIYHKLKKVHNTLQQIQKSLLSKERKRRVELPPADGAEDVGGAMEEKQDESPGQS